MSSLKKRLVPKRLLRAKSMDRIGAEDTAQNRLKVAVALHRIQEFLRSLSL